MHEKHFQDEEKNELQNIIQNHLKDIESQLDLHDTFKIEIPEGEFYVIKNLGDGNYLAVDTYGKVYGMIHDPYEIDKLFESIADFKAGIVSGLFDIKKYYDRKMSNPS
ncbi:hypothetical protein LVD17_04910 [Fulvivirga ulvae]|uniref:hypothetical protein n=1 Tax=Fulvivirga ulvae TaxID=2904245 RepID=UPI001F174FEC|nr:hypothetical protein [Fulvivirga ulvae]UII33166.1 hypothetical protein LVD17_04910 [Fulvivirga ulvae]